MLRRRHSKLDARARAPRPRLPFPRLSSCRCSCSRRRPRRLACACRCHRGSCKAIRPRACLSWGSRVHLFLRRGRRSTTARCRYRLVPQRILPLPATCNLFVFCISWAIIKAVRSCAQFFLRGRFFLTIYFGKTNKKTRVCFFTGLLFVLVSLLFPYNRGVAQRPPPPRALRLQAELNNKTKKTHTHNNIHAPFFFFSSDAAAAAASWSAAAASTAAPPDPSPANPPAATAAAAAEGLRDDGGAAAPAPRTSANASSGTAAGERGRDDGHRRRARGRGWENGSP